MSNINEDELELAQEITQEQIEPIKQIVEHRKRVQENRQREQKLKELQEERRELELQVSLRRERDRIERAKQQLKQIYCDDCHKWVDPEHFD